MDDTWDPFDPESLLAQARDTRRLWPTAGEANARPGTAARAKAKWQEREAEPFIHVTDRALLAGVRAVDGAQELAVWLFILREHRVRQGRGQSGAFALTTATLRAWAGIGRSTKSRALQKLAAADLVRIERDGARRAHE